MLLTSSWDWLETTGVCRLRHYPWHESTIIFFQGSGDAGHRHLPAVGGEAPAGHVIHGGISWESQDLGKPPGGVVSNHMFIILRKTMFHHFIHSNLCPGGPGHQVLADQGVQWPGLDWEVPGGAPPLCWCSSERSACWSTSVATRACWWEWVSWFRLKLLRILKHNLVIDK